MPKNNNRYQLLDDLDLSNSVSVEDRANLKFNLYLRSREIKQIVFYLEKSMLKKKSERDSFINENRSIIESLMKIFVESSNLTLEGMQLDQESVQLSMQLAVDLRKSISLINALLYSGIGLAS
jgi:lipid II:glycine glycyltransferase (peptidoglycan interpeptide bridge formation enzyme)